MIPVFADTSFYVALFSAEDAWHSQAAAWVTANWRPIVTTEFVLVELGSALCRGHLRDVFLRAITTARSEEGTEIVPVSSGHIRAPRDGPRGNAVAAFADLLKQNKKLEG